MRENAGRISYWKEIYFILTLWRRASYLKRERYVSATRSSCGSTQKKSMMNCSRILLRNSRLSKEYKIFRCDAAPELEPLYAFFT